MGRLMFYDVISYHLPTSVDAARLAVDAAVRSEVYRATNRNIGLPERCVPADVWFGRHRLTRAAED